MFTWSLRDQRLRLLLALPLDQATSKDSTMTHSAASTQDFSNHGRIVKPFHVGLSLILLTAFVLSLWNLYRAWERGGGRLAAVSIVLLTLAGFHLFWYCRIFALKAQDRAIRAEENLRHYVLTSSLIDPRVTTRQVIGLRFAPDDEFLELTQKAAEEGLSEKEIKQEIKNWKADEYRV